MPGSESYRLNTLSAQLGLPSFSHHDAGADAVACAALVLKIAETTGLDDLDELWPATAPRASSGRRRS